MKLRHVFIALLAAAVPAVALSSILAAQNVELKTAYLGLDRNEYPGDGNMAALHDTFAFTGYWLSNPPGSNRNSWQGKRKQLLHMGYGFLLLFNGREYRQLKASGNAARVGASDAMTAVDAARREGFPRRAIIFLDQEQGGRMLPEQRAYIHAWVDGVARGGYRAGVYCSGISFHESGGVSVVTADDIREHAGGREIHFFVSNDRCGPAPGCVFPFHAPSPAESAVKFAEVWQYAQSPRRAEMTASCRNTYAPDGNCYPPGMPLTSGLHIDVDTASSRDPSQAASE